MAIFPLYGNDVFVLDDLHDIHPVYTELSIYEDTNGKLDFKDILKNKKLPFHRWNGQNLSYGITNSAVWGKFYISRKDGEDQNWNLVNHYCLIDALDIYIPQKDGSYKHISSGNQISFKDREFKHRYLIFSLGNLNDKLPVYFRIQTNDEALEIRMFVTSDSRLLKYLVNDSFQHGALIGIVLLVIFYNAVIYIVNRDLSYVYYLLYVFFYWILQLGLYGYVYQYIFPDNYHYAQLLRNTSAHLSSIFALLFAIEFMKIQMHFPRFGIFLKTLIGLFILNLLITLSINYVLHNYIFYLLLLVSCLSLIYSGFISYRIFPYAKYYFAGWSFFLIVLMVYTMRMINIFIPYVTAYATTYGGIVEILMLAFALGKRIQNIREEKEKAELTAIENNFRAQSLTFRNTVLENDLDLARSMQNRMIPDLQSHPDMESIYMPMEKVGGDFFDILNLDKNSRGIFFGDVTGHGVSAALITSLIKSSFANELRNTEIITKGKNGKKHQDLLVSVKYPRATLSLLNDTLVMFSRQHYLSCVYGILDRCTDTFTFCSANHPPLFYLYQNDGQVMLDFISSSPQSPLLGVWSKEKFKSIEIGMNLYSLKKGSRLILASDGFIETVGYEFEAMEKGIESFSNTPVYELFKNFHKFDSKTFIAELQHILNGILNTSPPADDICLLIVDT